ncbi:SubName: Full=Uncharacterized protein {ECO:0000313/EMBL:CCA75368.1} [Serendipita indica DSM 11827]|uniref:Uncharacterized protein n=1 Tax=Serendipita indica (strain DSM 11827) TaxID=1109443 RepID=G4TVM5_SERID|nr:SubName: Full=Uncharacterized protein {ECO:0000313/EMBL:CCA75368.1} [Serendipita indica DSM 11827]CCA75368.1 hypothetical protein PIIN_09352 [Serendipita indica DSM 11827]
MEPSGYGSAPHRPRIYHAASYNVPPTYDLPVPSDYQRHPNGRLHRNYSEPVGFSQRNVVDPRYDAQPPYPSQPLHQIMSQYPAQPPAEYGSNAVYQASHRPAYDEYHSSVPLHSKTPPAPPMKPQQVRRSIGQDESTVQEPKRPAFPFKFRRKAKSTPNVEEATASAQPLPASKGPQLESLPPHGQGLDETSIKQGSATEEATRLRRQTMLWFKSLIRSSGHAQSRPSGGPVVLQKVSPVEVDIPKKEVDSANGRDQRRRRDSRPERAPEVYANPPRDSSSRRLERRNSGGRSSDADPSRRRESSQYQRRGNEPAHAQAVPTQSSRRRERGMSQPLPTPLDAGDSRYGRAPARPRSRSRERDQGPRRSSRRYSTREDGYTSKSMDEGYKSRREESHPIVKADPSQVAVPLQKASSIISNRERSHSVLESERPTTGDRPSTDGTAAPSQRPRAPSLRSILKPPPSTSAIRLPWEGDDMPHSGVERGYDPRHSEYRRRRSDSNRSTQRPPSSSSHYDHEPARSVTSKSSIRSHSPSTRYSTESGGQRAEQVKVNTKHNATNLTYQPHRDAAPALQYGSVPVQPIYYSDQEYPRTRRRSSTSAARPEYVYADPYGHYSDYDRREPRGHRHYAGYAYHGAEYAPNYYVPTQEYSPADYGPVYPVYR